MHLLGCLIGAQIYLEIRMLFETMGAAALQSMLYVAYIWFWSATAAIGHCVIQFAQ
jgi:hypothetical protein